MDAISRPQKRERDLIAENALLKRRIKAVENMGACLRTGLRPTEKLFTELEQTERMLKKYD